MSTDDEMTIDEERKYLRKMQKRYAKADRKQRRQLLDEMEVITGKHRKSLVRLMNSSLERKTRCKQRGETYGLEVDDALRVIDESLDYICAERLTPNLVWLTTHLAAHGEMEAPPSLLEQLEHISISTVRRRLNRTRQDQPRLPRRKGPSRTNKLTQDIPMIRIPWDEQEPGHFEVDLVHHCGPTARGEYVCSLQMLDVATAWSERVATLGRSYLVMEDAFLCILARLPFPVLEIHPDNDSVFFNHHMLRFWGEMVQGVRLSRSRPYHKNDNRFAEQKNSTLIRAYLGNERLDTVAQTLALNHLYDRMWLYYNFFQPVMRLKEKIIIPGADGRPARVKYRYDDARTPFDRLCDTDAITQEHREQLEALRDQTNPRQLRQEIYDWIDYIFSLPSAVPGVTEDVHLTLRVPYRLEIGGDPQFVFSFDRTTVSR
ncbi:MAG: integrase [Chloroflexota bacterium]|nr:integrase [Chloroflexota bacterium]